MDPLARSIAAMQAANAGSYRTLAAPPRAEPCAPVAREPDPQSAAMLRDALWRSYRADMLFKPVMALAAALFVVGLLNLVRS
jgi:hypothetical protein